MGNKNHKMSSLLQKIGEFRTFNVVLLMCLLVGFITAPIVKLSYNLPIEEPDLSPGSEQSFKYKNQDVLYYIPNALNTSLTKIFFVIHGYSRTYDSYFEKWMDTNVAETENVVMIAPLFDTTLFQHYQILNIWGIRADLRLIELGNQFINWLNLDNERFYMFGFSGGGQFVHRFAMTHPDKIDRAVAGAPGWYTFPTDSFYPYGVQTTILHPWNLHFYLEYTCNSNLGLIVGDEDTERTSNLMQSPLADSQGENRLERAQNWFTAMNNTAISNGWTFNMEYKEVAGAGHSSSQMIPDSKNFLFGGGF